jgi:hypothetical protein
MANQELAAWGGGQTVDATNGWNNPANFNLDFNNFGGGINAVVVSADPYFQRHRDDLIAAANPSGKYICYPFRAFANVGGAHRPTSDNAVIIGPDLHANNPDGAYFMMGAMTTAILNGSVPNPGVNKRVAQIIFPL